MHECSMKHLHLPAQNSHCSQDKCHAIERRVWLCIPHFIFINTAFVTVLAADVIQTLILTFTWHEMHLDSVVKGNKNQMTDYYILLISSAMTEGVKSASTGCGTDIIIMRVMTITVATTIFWRKQKAIMVMLWLRNFSFKTNGQNLHYIKKKKGKKSAHQGSKNAQI